MSLLICLSVAGCQKRDLAPSDVSGPPATASPEHAQLDDKLSLTDFKSLPLPPLSCGSKKGCPSGIGELVTVSSEGLRFCTVSLVDQDIVLTAGHCIPVENINPNDNTITGGCWVRWASGPVVACAKIIAGEALSGEPNDQVRLDHVFIRQNSLHLLRLHDEDADPAPNRDLVVLFGIDLEKEQHMIKGIRCLRADDTDLPGLSKLSGDTIVLPHCPIQPGYSGGPILEPHSGLVIGVVSFMKLLPNDSRESGPAVGTDVMPLSVPISGPNP
jgi:hypothetical protein